MKALVIDDDLVLSDVVAFTLRRAGFEVAMAHDGETGLERWRAENPDLIILDLKLPKMDGLAVCRRIRSEAKTPIIMLSVQGDDEDIVHGLEMGADDYITKPFSPTQLVARARAVLRRAGVQPTIGILTVGNLTLNPQRRELNHVGQASVQLTQLECRLLEVLMANSGHVLATDTLIAQVWGPAGGDKVMLKQLVHRLRRKLNPDESGQTYLDTVPGVGYVFISR